MLFPSLDVARRLDPPEGLGILCGIALITAVVTWAIYRWVRDSWDDRWALRLNRVELPTSIDTLIRGISHLGLFPVSAAIWLGLWAVVALYSYLLTYGRLTPPNPMDHYTVPAKAIVDATGASTPMLVSGCLCFLLWVTCRAIKRSTDRERPYQRLAGKGVVQRGMMPSGSSFPSSHSAMVFFTWPLIVVMGQTYLDSWALLLPAIFTVIAVSGSRIYLGAHFPRDVLAGLTLGVGFAALAIVLSRMGYAWWQDHPFAWWQENPFFDWLIYRMTHGSLH